MLTVYAVVFSNYHPTEVNSLWATKELADTWAMLLNDEDGAGMWKVEEYVVRDEIPKGDTHEQHREQPIGNTQHSCRMPQVREHRPLHEVVRPRHARRGHPLRQVRCLCAHV
jgi:hypothetical protein